MYVHRLCMEVVQNYGEILAVGDSTCPTGSQILLVITRRQVCIKRVSSFICINRWLSCFASTLVCMHAQREPCARGCGRSSSTFDGCIKNQTRSLPCRNLLGRHATQPSGGVVRGCASTPSSIVGCAHAHMFGGMTAVFLEPKIQIYWRLGNWC